MIDLNQTLLLATVQHTGTMWLLERLGWDKKSGRGRNVAMITEPQKLKEGGILFAHATDFEMPLIVECAQKLPLVTTSRPIDDVRASWIRRGESLDELDRQLANYDRLVRELGAHVIDIQKPAP
jgi:hypothetical protein